MWSTDERWATAFAAVDDQLNITCQTPGMHEREHEIMETLSRYVKGERSPILLQSMEQIGGVQPPPKIKIPARRNGD